MQEDGNESETVRVTFIVRNFPRIFALFLLEKPPLNHTCPLEDKELNEKILFQRE